jgi:sugar/nucleoside kinase (ribokinase family)
MAKKRLQRRKEHKAVKGKFDVISVGSATVDCFVSLPVDFTHIKHGSKVLIENISLTTGGGGTNVAVGMSRLGLRTGFIGEVGDDLSANMIKHDLEREGVKFLVKQHSRHQTAYSVVLEAKGKDRAILVYKGASSYLDAGEIPKRLSTDWFYFASVVGNSFKTMEHVASFARKNNIKVYFNPSSYMTEQGYDYLKKVISATTVLSLNKEEAQALLGLKTNSFLELLRGLHKLGPEVCIITDGSNGAYAYDGTLHYFKKVRKMQPVDTTGAGDAFGAGFLAGFIIKKGVPLDRRIRFAMDMGMRNAESVIMFVGAKKGLLTKRKAMELVGD